MSFSFYLRNVVVLDTLSFCWYVCSTALLPTIQLLLEEIKYLDNWFVFGVHLRVPVKQLIKIESSHHVIRENRHVAILAKQH